MESGIKRKSMKREILFRGKRKDNGEWAYGSLSVEYEGTIHISYWVSTLVEADTNSWEPIHHVHEVDPETVGQYTNLNDKNGTKIFEGDMLKDKDGIEYEVIWFGTRFEKRDSMQSTDLHSSSGYLELEVIGNIYQPKI
jgi:hypothetical protein